MHKAKANPNNSQMEWEMPSFLWERQATEEQITQWTPSCIKLFMHPKHKHFNHIGNSQVTTVKITMIKPMRKKKSKNIPQSKTQLGIFINFNELKLGIKNQ